MIRLSVGIACMLLLASETRAAVTTTFNTGQVHETTGFSGVATTTADMVGVQVSVVFDSGATDQQTWTNTGVATSNWTISAGTGSTYSSPFQLTNLTNDPIVSFRINTALTNTAFDANLFPSTTGTANGRTLLEFGSFISASQDVDVSYFDQVQLSGDTPIGDIYAGLEVDFEDGFANSTFSFLADTDTSSSLILPVVTSVPEPSSFAILAALTIGVATRRRRKL